MSSIRRNRFLRVGERRINNALRSIKLVGNLGDRTNYDYNKADVQQIERALKDALSGAMARFKSKKNPEEEGFKFK